MLIGLLSDTHDHRANLARAIGMFKKMHVNLILHAGDFCSPFTALEWPAEPWCKLIGVFGNNDGDRSALSQAWRRQARVENEQEVITTDAGFLFLCHQPQPAEEAAHSKRYQFVVHGHTHLWRDERVDGVMLINPGECCGWLSGKATIAVLDTVERSVLRLELGG
jgi:uncharacterized protein